MSIPASSAPAQASPNAGRRATRIAMPASPRTGMTPVAREVAVGHSAGRLSSRVVMLCDPNRPPYWPRNCSPVTRKRNPCNVVGWL
jgi:hypothetical protein